MALLRQHLPFERGLHLRPCRGLLVDAPLQRGLSLLLLLLYPFEMHPHLSLRVVLVLDLGL